MSGQNIYKAGVQNVSYSIFAQGIAFVLSIVLGFILPKTMGIVNFGYWQVYLFYTGYIMLFCLGFNDGLYLRYGCFDFNDLPLKRLRGAMILFIGIILIITLILFALSFIEQDPNKIFCFCATSLNLLILGINGTLLTILQFTNQIKLNSILTIANKVIFLFAIIGLLFMKWVDFRIIICADIFTKLIILIVNMYKFRQLFIGQSEGFYSGLEEYFMDVQVGIRLMLSNIVGSLLVGIGRFIVERFMSLESYSAYSLATSITSFSLVFIASSSLAFYPFLRRIAKEKLPDYYPVINKLLCVSLFLILAGYYPLYFIIKHYFPAYSESLEYLYLLFVVVVSQGKMLFMINTYYKALREEKAMLIANLSGIVVALIIIIPAFYLTRSIMAIVWGTTVTLVWRCYASEIYLKQKMGISKHGDMVIELLMIVFFIICVIFCNLTIGLILYLGAVLGYIFINRIMLDIYLRKIFSVVIAK
jgi:O-antigen/teichoic acid export membrane protein